MLEGTGSLPLLGGVLRPRVVSGLRYDGGDAETGAGIELGGGLAYAAGRLSLELNARGLLAHQDRDYEEWGFSTSMQYRAHEDSRGLSMRVGSEWGATQSGVQSMWQRPDASQRLPTAQMPPSQRLRAELNYGFLSKNEKSLWVPFLQAESATGNQALRFGLRMNNNEQSSAAIDFTQHININGEAQNAILLQAEMRW